MATDTETGATLDDLYRVEGKAELIGGKVVRLMPTGRRPNRIASRIFRSLDDHAEAAGRGEAYTDNVGFAVPELRSGRQSFSPDASYFAGPFPADAMRFLVGPPTFAAEVRSEGDYGPAAEAAMASKRADYFEAGTLALWDVDPEAETVALYVADSPTTPVIFARGRMAGAEPAVSGWRVSVDAIFGG